VCNRVDLVDGARTLDLIFAGPESPSYWLPCLIRRGRIHGCHLQMTGRRA
jgi:hypothetical protein